MNLHLARLDRMAELQRCYRHPDRETGVSCSECGRGICPDCMTFSPVGIRCPDHSGQARGAAKVVQNVQRRSTSRPGIVTTTLIAINVGIYLLQLAGGASMNGSSGWIYEHGALFIQGIDSSGNVVGLGEGEWYRLLTAAFLHYGPIHLALNMLALWWIGRPLEDYLGPLRYLLLYLVSGIAGSAGALIASPGAITVGASGAIFGVLGAAIVLERQKTYVLGGSAITLLVVNLAFTFAVPGISIGGHLGGLAGGALCILALSRFGKGNAAYSRIDLVSIASLVAVGLLSVAVAYWKVRGYA
jgi:membrane associated rhomboid family serine protease